MKPLQVIGGALLTVTLGFFAWGQQRIITRLDALDVAAAELRSEVRNNSEWRNSWSNYPRNADDMDRRMRLIAAETIDAKLAAITRTQEHCIEALRRVEIALRDLDDIKARVAKLESR